MSIPEEKERYFRETAVVLGRGGFQVERGTDSGLRVRFEGEPLCEVTEDGGIIYRMENVRGPERRDARDQVYEAVRTTAEYMRIFSGVKGVHWDVIDGVAQPLDSAIQMKKEGGDAWTKSGISNAALYGMVGMARGVLLDDGAPTDLYRSEGYFVKDLDAIDQDFCSYYGDYTYPNQVLLDKGTKDFANLDMRIASGYGTAPEDIQRIDTKLLDMALKAIPTLIMAGDDDSFAKLKADTIQAFIEAGADQSREWWKGRHDELMEKYGK